MNKKSNLSSQIIERLLNGILKENPTFVLLLGMCPTLAVTTSAMNGLGMGLTTMAVLSLSNLMISALRKIIPNKVRIPAFIVIIASFVTIVELLLKAYITSLYDALGLYIPLIVVNCIILGRAEAYAYSNPVLPSLFDGIGMGLGFSIALTIIGGVREILGAGQLFGFNVMPSGYIPVSIFIMAPGAFFVLAILTAIQNAIKIAGEKKGKDMSKIQSGCGHDCMNCDKDCKVPSKGEAVKKPKKVLDLSNKVKSIKDDVIKDKIKKEQSTEKKENKIISSAENITNNGENLSKDNGVVTPESKVAESVNAENVEVSSSESSILDSGSELQDLAVDKDLKENVSDNLDISVSSESISQDLASDNADRIENIEPEVSDFIVTADNSSENAISKNIAIATSENIEISQQSASDNVFDDMQVEEVIEATEDDVKIYVNKPRKSSSISESRKEFDSEFAKLLEMIAADETIGEGEELHFINTDETEEVVLVEVENVEDDYEETVSAKIPSDRMRKSFHGKKNKKSRKKI